MEVTKSWFPWVYERETSRVLLFFTLESLAVAIALKLRYGRGQRKENTKVVVVSSITDKRGKGAALNKLMSTKFPSSAVLMELAAHLKNRGLWNVVEWAPREFNREADRVANGVTEGFNPQLEMKLQPEELRSHSGSSYGLTRKWRPFVVLFVAQNG